MISKFEHKLATQQSSPDKTMKSVTFGNQITPTFLPNIVFKESEASQGILNLIREYYLWQYDEFVLEKFSYQLAEDVSAVVGIKEAITWKYKWLRIAWAIAFILGILGTGWVLRETITEYYSDPTATKVRFSVFRSVFEIILEQC